VHDTAWGPFAVNGVGSHGSPECCSFAFQIALVAELLNGIAADLVDLLIGIHVVDLGCVPAEHAVAYRTLGVRPSVRWPIALVRMRGLVVIGVVAIEPWIPTIAL
jgi:hypothetical protein